MDTLSVVAEAAPIEIPVEDHEAAGRYIAAIVARDRFAPGHPRFAAWRTRQLCRQSFSETDARHRLALLGRGWARCSACVWLVDHPEAGLKTVAWARETHNSTAAQAD